MEEVYRSAASVLVLRAAPGQEDGSYQILLLHKPRKRDAWQLPQGGLEAGETMEQAALRELHEEAGLSDVRVLGMGEKVYQYEFPASYRRFRPDHVKGQRIEFVLAFAQADANVQVDKNEIDKHLWVFPGQVRTYIKRKEYIDLVHALYQQALSLL